MIRTLTLVPPEGSTRPGVHDVACAGVRDAARDGVRDVVPLLVGFLPFALLVGTAIAAHGPLLARWLGTFTILGGSTQLVVLRLLDGGAPVALVVLGGLATNMRLLAYSGSLARPWSGHSRGFRAAAAALMVDPTWALASRDLSRTRTAAAQRAYFLTAGVTLTAGWGAIVTTGMVVGSGVRSAEVLALAAPISLAGLIAPQLVSRGAASVVVTAAVAAWVTATWAPGTGMLAAMLAAAAVGTLVDGRSGTAAGADEAVAGGDARGVARTGAPEGVDAVTYEETGA